MAGKQAFVASVVGLPQFPWIKEVNVRSGPGTNKDLLFKVAVGTKNVKVLEVKVDDEERNQGGKVFQWFRLDLPQGDGWIRDDLITVQGDGTEFGYMNLNKPVIAFNLRRKETGTVDDSGEAETPAPPVPPEPSTPDETDPPPPPETEPGAPHPGPATGTCMGASGVSVRSAPTTEGNNRIGRLQRKQTVEIIDSAKGQDDPSFMWAKVKFDGKEGWCRSDYLRLSGSFEQFNLGHEDRYPNPAPESTWSRGWDTDGSRFGAKHDGWDHAGVTGAPLLAGPNGGEVVLKKFCQRCTDQGFSVTQRGFSVGSSQVLSDQGWNFGYGHYVIVRYDHEILPDSTKAELKERGFGGGHLFVMYAHMHDMFVDTGDTLTPNQQLGTMGNSGNSTGTHLHLEVRAGTDAAEKNWWKLKNGLMTPEVLFLR
jgi:murein DD-endopeptidase MepM/ murein hydrolase activator NlpD